MSRVRSIWREKSGRENWNGKDLGVGGIEKREGLTLFPSEATEKGREVVVVCEVIGRSRAAWQQESGEP